jgi:hypothetical protein
MCHVRTSNGSNQEENTYAFKWSGSPPTAPELASLASSISTVIGGALRALTSDGWVFREVYCRNIDTEVASEATYVFPSGTTGLRSGSQVAANEACGIVKRTGLTGRGSHGRNSISGFAESDVDGNSIGSSLMAALINLALQTLVSYLASRFVPAVAHIPRTVGPTGTSTALRETIVLDNNIDSQKTRLNSHGR